MFDVFKQVAESLYSYAKEYAKAKKERKEKIAILYENMGACLKEASAILKKGVIPLADVVKLKLTLRNFLIQLEV